MGISLLLKIHVKEEGGKIEKYLDTGEQLPPGAKRVSEENTVGVVFLSCSCFV